MRADSSCTGIAEATVAVVLHDGWLSHYITGSDEDGYFTLSGLQAPGLYKLGVIADGYRMGWLEAISVSPGAVVPLAPLALESACSIAVDVVDWDSGAPVAGAEVSLSTELDGNQGPTLVADGQGHCEFTLGDPQGGSPVVTASSDAVCSDSVFVNELSPGEVRGITLALDRVSPSVQILEPQPGSDVSGVVPILVEAGDNAVVGAVWTDATGEG